MSKNIYSWKSKFRRGLINTYHYFGIDKLLAQLCIGRFKISLDTAFSRFLSIEDQSDKELIKELKKDIVLCYKRYLTTPEEYFLFNFQNNNSHTYRSAFLSDNFRTRILLRKGGQRLFNELTDKYYFYSKTKKYFKRKMMIVGPTTDFVSFKNFAGDMENIFVKPISGTYGQGCCVYDVSDSLRAKQSFDFMVKSGIRYVVEEKIVQSDEMGSWNQSSCNTLRLPCFLNEQGFHILQPFFRTGRKGDIVDNAGAGGLFILVDEKSGKLCSEAIDKSMNRYTHHPDSGLKYEGWQIPKWDELLDLAESIFRECLSEHSYVGFDFALTDKGWVLVEGNWGQFVGQYINSTGVKEKFLNYMLIK